MMSRKFQCKFHVRNTRYINSHDNGWTVMMLHLISRKFQRKFLVMEDFGCEKLFSVSHAKRYFLNRSS